MNKMKMNLFLAMAVMGLSACTTTDNLESMQPGDNLSAGMATVHFEARTSGLNVTTFGRNSITTNYTVDDLRILAFRQDNADNAFKYIGDVKKDEITMVGDKFTGKAQLPVGTYKFIPMYGLNDQVQVPALSNTVAYGDDLALTHAPANTLPAIFLQNADVTVKEYTLGVTDTERNATVQLALKRAIARLDVQFVRADKAGDVYTEKAGETVLGPANLASMKITMNGITSKASMTKGVVTSDVIDYTYTVPVASALTEGTAVATQFGGEGYNFDAVAEGDFIDGSVHVQGPYVFPYADNTQSATLAIELTSGKDNVTGQVYTRTLNINGVKLLRNQVTLVKIYVTGDDLFHTSVGFEVTLNKAWDDVIDDSWGAAE